ncbi:MAG: hypothetical protein HC822_04075 [Oscillochloris sp.]|nr:hypothetical protein [Oscillochloris sp.]
MASIVLAATHHDPDGRLYDQTARILPQLQSVYAGIVLQLTPQTTAETVDLLRRCGVRFRIGSADLPTGHLHLGLWRRGAVAAGLNSGYDVGHYHFCDLDRVLHWAEFHLDELRATLAELPEYDLTVLGRTQRAFASHPRAQTATEALANRVFGLVWGAEWDIAAAARGLSARAARLIVDRCDDDTVGSDCSWPLIARGGGLLLGYRETEGLEFETLDRFGDEIAALGGPQIWIDRFDADPQQWLLRMDLARAEAESAWSYRNWSL